MKHWLMVCLLVAATASAQPTRTILVFGDSISAGYGLPVGKGWVALLRAKLEREGYGYRVVNASVSGETTAGGLDRLPRALALHRPRILILELGGNDGLRALPVAPMRANLERMVRLARAAGATVLLLGMRIPPNYGPEYAGAFQRAFTLIARTDSLPFVPFLLQGIALRPALMQADGLHPNVRGQPRLLANVWPALQPLLGR
ncbi:MAG TPA: arylesterase [Steroidobacteraceae bacterium]|nr:arylesterase [Steroidobacteraceae bacterium]